MIPCIIPARGGSKGIPRKNVVPVGGKPLIAWSIEQALAAQRVDYVVVATDDAEIADIATQYGADVFHRSKASSTDDAPSEMVLLEVYDSLPEPIESIVFLQATSPIRQPSDIDNAYDEFVAGQYDSLFSGRIVEGYCWRHAGGQMLRYESVRSPRQSRSFQCVEENGSIYIFRPVMIQDTGHRLGGRIGCYPMHPLDSFQIDEPSDIALIEQLMEVRCDSHARA